MNLNNMRYFVSVVRHGGISKAAAQEHVTQQTMSAHMAALERELGCSLLVRKPAFALTDEGERFLQYCERFLQLEDSMRSEFADIRGDVGGVLRVASTTTRGRVLMPEAIHRFRALYPRAKVNLLEGRNEDLFQWLSEGAADIALGRVPGEDASYLSKRLYGERMMLMVPKAFLDARQAGELERTRDLRILREQPFLLSYESDIAGSFGRLLIAQAGFAGNFAAEADSAATLLAMVSDGVGSCFCPDSLIEVCTTSEQRDRMLQIPLDASYQIGVAWRSAPYTDRMTAAFVGILEEVCSKRFGG